MMNMNVIHWHRWAFLQHSTCTNRHVAHSMRNDQYRRHNSWDLVLPTFRNLTMPYRKTFEVIGVQNLVLMFREPVAFNISLYYLGMLHAQQEISQFWKFFPHLKHDWEGEGTTGGVCDAKIWIWGRGQDQCKEGMYLPRRTAARTLNDRSLDLEIPGIELTIKIFRRTHRFGLVSCSEVSSSQLPSTGGISKSRLRNPGICNAFGKSH